ncbi:MAG: ATP-dependent DNA helicase [Kiritimatiellia bacterium]
MKQPQSSLPLFMDDPNWAAFLPEVVADGPRCALPAHEDCSPLDTEATARHLERGGTLGSMPGYELRPGQLDVLRAIVRAFNGREHLMIEAGTGVGKSLAYLVPAVQWSFVNETPVVISTATRNLQSQLIDCDLPRAAKSLGDDAAGFRAAVLKGRMNYLCLRALDEFMQAGYYSLTEDEKADMLRLVDWLHRTQDGDLDDLGAETLRPKICCADEDCHGRSCRYHAKCFIQKARVRALKAHVVIANHALVLAEATSAAGGLLPAYGRLVFDEAHNLEDIATDFFSSELSKPALMHLMGKLSRTTRAYRGTGRPRGVLGNIDRQLKKGAFREEKTAMAVRELVSRARVQSKLAVGAYDRLSEIFDRLFRPAPRQTVVRYRCMPQRQYSLEGLFADYPPHQWDEAELRQAADGFEDALARLQGILGRLAEELVAAAADEQSSLVDLAAQVKALSGSFTQFILEAKFVLAGTDPSHVYWVERCPGTSGTRTSPYVRLVAAPLSIAQQMKRCFYDAKDSVVLCSATLRTGDRFDYMARKLGVSLVEDGRVRSLVASSPFNYLRQALVLVPGGLPDPASQTAAYVARTAAFLVALFRTTKGRALVLFTAYEMMKDVAERTREPFEDAGIRLCVQGEGLSREAMTQMLRTAGERPVVLFGAQSFWEGVDVPGDALSCVVLARLPFPQMGEPIVEARCEKIVEAGGSQFRDYMLPEAVIRFRQGFGRLVRTKSDHGVVVITDPRIVTRNYGAVLRKSIPASVHAVATPEEALRRVGDFLRE